MYYVKLASSIKGTNQINDQCIAQMVFDKTDTWNIDTAVFLRKII